jgi:DNA-binding response OmpR family regulator
MIERILIVDDEAEARFSLPLPLEDAGYIVATASDGPEALDFLREGGHEVDLLVLDIEMPRLNGLQLLDALQGIGIHLPCIVISGYGDKATLVELLRRGVDDFLDKPFQGQDLLAAISAVTARWAKRPQPEPTPTAGQAADPPTATWEIQAERDECRIRLHESIAEADAETLRRLLIERLDAGQRRFACDLAGLDDLHPVLLSVLLRFADLLNEQHLPPLRLLGFGSHLSQFFHITNAADQFHLDLECLP